MTRHLKACLGQQPSSRPGDKTQKTFVISVAGKYWREYWLYLEVPAAALLLDLDRYLRDIWLECCGHLSAFTIEEVDYQLNTGMVDSMWLDFFGPSHPVKSMKTKLYQVLQPGLTFDHRYDFGTPTDLKLKVIEASQRVGSSKEITLLARNDPPNIRCAECGEPAMQVCSQCIYQGPSAWLCEQHARSHPCGEEMFLPVVNSPRVGECGYTGPS
jgi:hypothetical protein